ncbi:pitrilysin family protein [Danxiaibacter flavus]|uniref:Pitrilysin family protein n=1 Tax=Danxiaibacter flavus TaxID=3049108 RepID=A0ABV3ZMB6_9BACT|nr:pitrilysin family protein [Chitinophagaceae bacterium DXS]
MINRKEEPAIKDAVDFNLQLKPYTYFQLDNGVPVYTIDAGAQDVVMVELVFFAGNWYEDKNIVAATTNYLLKNGTTKKNAFAINEHFEFYGAYLNRNCYNETATISLHALSKHLPELLPVVTELLTDATLPEDELAIYKQNQKQRLEVNLKKGEFVANRLIDEYLYGYDHPYGKYTLTGDYDALQREDLEKFYKQYYSEGKCLLFVAGKLPSDIQEQLNKSFGHLALNKADIPQITHLRQPAVQKKYEVINDANGVQGAIRIARPFPNRHHPDFTKVQVLNNIFGGFFGSRLMSNIREEKGYTYGIYSYLQNHVESSAWMVSTEAGRDVSRATIEEVYKEMEILRKELVDDEEMHLVKNYMMGSILGDLDGPFQVISRWKNYVLNNLTEEYFYNSINTIRAITAEEIRDLANKYLVADEFYELVVV